MMKRLVWTLAALMLVCANLMAQRLNREPSRIVVAYVTSNPTVMPDPSRMTHINYAFGHVNDTFNGVRINNESRLHSITALKKDAPWLKVCLSIGGWGSGRFSEMAATDENRKAFAADCARVVAEFDLDGIDLDWEYPTSSAAGISSSPDDTKNFTILVKEIRKAIGPRKLLTMASPSNARFVDFPNVLPYMDFINVMAYDMGRPPRHNAALYRQDEAGNVSPFARGSADRAIQAHLDAGIPKEKLTLGMPLYGHGDRKNYNDYVDFKDMAAPKEGLTEHWDEIARVPYYADAEGKLVLSFDNVRSITEKCQYIKDKGLLGGMYWEYICDNASGDLTRTIANQLLPKRIVSAQAVRKASYAGKEKRFRALLYYSDKVEEAHSQFANQAVQFFKKLTVGDGWTLDVAKDKLPSDLSAYDVVIMPDVAPGSKSDRARFQEYMENGGGWLGFHGAGYNDASTGWDWFRDFLGGVSFLCNTWPPQPALIDVDGFDHPVTRNLPSRYVAPSTEYYQWQPDPRSNPDIVVLASLARENFPMGLKDVVFGGDFPVVWTNTNYRMVYINMGHGDESFTDATQNLLFINALRWVVSRSPKGDPFQK
jgi:chitinase